MTFANSRQKTLYVCSRLYELAAEFTDEEFREMLVEQAANPAIKNAIAALRGLHGANEVDMAALNRSLEATEPIPKKERKRDSSTLSSMFEDRSVFPSVGSIVAVTRFAPRPKEARDRYLSRLAKNVEGMSMSERQRFLDHVAGNLSDGGNFISKWSRVIERL